MRKAVTTGPTSHKGVKTVSVDISHLASTATSLEMEFLKKSKKLKTINFEGFDQVKTIGRNFMIECDGLTTADLSGLTSVRDLSGNFLKSCGKLTDVHFGDGGLKDVEMLSDCFMNYCTSLRHLDLSHMNSLAGDQGSWVLHDCHSLETLSLGDWSKVTKIGNEFLVNCRSLQEVKMTHPASFGQIHTLCFGFMWNCSALKSIDLSGFSGVTKIEDMCFAKCSSLKKVDLSGFKSVQHIGIRLLGDCTNLEEVNFSGLSALVKVEDGFLADCPNLKVIRIGDDVTDALMEKIEHRIKNQPGIELLQGDGTEPTSRTKRGRE